MPARIIIGGDLVPTESNRKLFAEANVDEMIGAELKELLRSADYTTFNLEVPLTDKESPIAKCGPNLIAPTETVNGLKAINPHFFTLANNHILDQGEQGLYSTMEVLCKAGIAYAGVGRNLDEASKGFIREIEGITIGIYCCAEHEFSIAAENSTGANPFDPLESLDHISTLKTKSDYVIVLYHGGKEHYRYPTPYLQKVCRKIVDKGADLVICQHSHCIGCEEKYRGGTIVYGQGNFIFDDSDNECWQTSFLVKIEGDFTISYLPLMKTGNGVRLADEEKGKEILDGFYARSEEIKAKGFIEKKYADFADSFFEFYLCALSGKRSAWFRVLNKISRGAYMKRYLRNAYGPHELVRIANYIDCEAHRELLSRAMSNRYSPDDEPSD